MFAIERQEMIEKLVNEQGDVRLSDLSARFGVSGETLRKDLLALEEAGKLIRTHGGAVRVSKARRHLGLKKRKELFQAQKKELCRTAAKFISEGDVIAIDEGSTAVYLAKILADRAQRLTVVTHSLEVFQILSVNEQIELILCAGEFLREESAFAGFLTTDAVKRIHVNKAFIFPSAVSLQFGVSDFGDQRLLEVQRAYIDNADEVFILADSGKFEKSGVWKICDADRAAIYITDRGISDAVFEAYSKQGIQLIRE